MHLEAASRNGRNIPVILNQDGSCIGKEDLRRLEATHIIVYDDSLKFNVTQVEDHIQEMLDVFSIPFRLHKHRAMGSNQEDPDQNHPDYLCKVFLTIIPFDKIVEQRCIVNGRVVVE